MSRRNRRPGLAVIYWRDIPAQVRAGSRTAGRKVLLDARFQHAIDRAAVVAGKTDTDSYVGEWRRVDEPLPSDAGPSSPAASQAVVAARAAELETDHPDEVLETLVRSGGWRPETTSLTEGAP